MDDKYRVRNAKNVFITTKEKFLHDGLNSID